LKTLDCLGDMCPVPTLKLKKNLENMKHQEQIKIVVDHSCVVQSILSQYSTKNFSIETEEVISGIWEITLTKK